jgi:hypothetical protein
LTVGAGSPPIPGINDRSPGCDSLHTGDLAGAPSHGERRLSSECTNDDSARPVTPAVPRIARAMDAERNRPRVVRPIRWVINEVTFVDEDTADKTTEIAACLRSGTTIVSQVNIDKRNALEVGMPTTLAW